MATPPQRILPCLDAGPPADEQAEDDYTNKVSASVKRLFDSSALWLENVTQDSNGDLAADVTPTLTALVKGMAFWYEAIANNAGPFNIGIGSAPEVEVLNAKGENLSGGEFLLGSLYKLVFNGTNLKIHSTIVNSDADVKAKPADQQTFLASGTWTKPTGFSAKAYVLIQVWGAGGGGARNSTSPFRCGGGSAGAYKERWMRLADLAASEAVTVGIGGAGRSGSSGAGNTGGQSSFGSKVLAYAGLGGVAAETHVAGGGLWGDGLGSTGDATQPWDGAGTGSRGVWGGGGGGDSVTTGSLNIAGGISLFAGNGGNGGPTPVAGTQPAGGGGAGANADGAKGGDGKVIVTVFDGL